jgi:hypothetical protein
MLGGTGAGTSNQGQFWARFVMAEHLGTWAMELMHVLCDFFDVRCIPGYVDCEGDVVNFDNMAWNGGMHPTALTKASIEWLDDTAIAKHTGRAVPYELHAVGLTQPPPPGRVTAVRVGSDVPYLMAEARLRVDPFEASSTLEPGISSEGVIVYRVQTSSPKGFPQDNHIPLYLLTGTALGVGQTIVTDSNVSVSVTGSRPGAFLVVVDDRSAPFVTGQLLFYRDTTQDGTGDVNTPGVIGLGGWQDMLHVFGGGNGIIYAVPR